MAMNLTVSITDSEQARIEAAAAQVAPGATSTQIREWAIRKAKAGIRDAVLDAVRDAEREAANAARQSFVTDFPDPDADPEV